ncbi:MAG: hypothetical protein ABR521_08580 [Gaiellaceae bacterium]
MRSPAGLTALAAAVALSATAGAALPGKNGRIAFTSNRDDPTLHVRGNYEIYTMNADGSGVARLTQAQGIDGTPVWSPDGRMLAFRTNRDHFDPDPTKTSYELYTMRADGSAQRRLTTNEAGDFSPTWSPDGKRIAFTSDRDGNQEIYVMNADGSGAANLTRAPGIDNEPAWSPDGKEIAFASNRGGPFRLWAMRPDGSAARVLSPGPQDHHPAWSPNGKRLAFARTAGGQIDLFVVNANGSGERRLTSEPTIEFQPAWSPDGRRILFSSDRGSDVPGLLHLHTMNADGSGASRLLTGAAADLEADWQSLPTAATAISAVRALLAAQARACKLAVRSLRAKAIAGGFRVTALVKKAGKNQTATFDVVGGTPRPVYAIARQIARGCR